MLIQCSAPIQVGCRYF